MLASTASSPGHRGLPCAASSAVALASFLIFNLFIGIVINSMEEARAIELRRAEKALLDDDAANDEQAHAVFLEERVHALRIALDNLERELASRRS